MRLLRIVVPLASIAAVLSGCVAVTLAPPGEYAVAKSYEVTLGRKWSDVSAVVPGRNKNLRVLTVDGMLLNRLYLAGALAPGDYMVRPLVKERPTPTVKADMSINERMEFVADNLSLIGYQAVETVQPRPAKFGEADAVRFDLTGRTPEGLDVRATALVAMHAGKLNLIVFVAPSEHYFEAGLPEVESLMRSATPAA